jgi:choline-glycine betaine transporter
MTASWRTTTAAIAAAIIAIGNGVRELIQHNTISNMPEIIATLTICAGLLNARDNKVTSEQAGAGTNPPTP